MLLAPGCLARRLLSPDSGSLARRLLLLLLLALCQALCSSGSLAGRMALCCLCSSGSLEGRMLLLLFLLLALRCSSRSFFFAKGGQDIIAPTRLHVLLALTVELYDGDPWAMDLKRLATSKFPPGLD